MNTIKITQLGLALLLTLSLVTTLAVPVANAKQLDSYSLPGAKTFPESIASQEGSPYFYVGSVTGGTIYRGDVKDPQLQPFLAGGQDGRTSVLGLKVDKGRLFVCGGGTGKIFVYDLANKKLLFSASDNLTPTIINDVAIAKDNTAYFTDSASPFLYRLSWHHNGDYTFEKWLDFSGTELVYQKTGFNANGIAVSEDGKYLLVIQTNTGKLYRIKIATKKVTQIKLVSELPSGTPSIVNGDGILLEGHHLLVARNANALITKIELSDKFRSGRIVSETVDPSFKFPTAIARKQGRLLVVNSQLNKRVAGLPPDLPFTISSIDVP